MTIISMNYLLINPRIALMAGGRVAPKSDPTLCNSKFFFCKVLLCWQDHITLCGYQLLFYTLRNRNVAMHDMIDALT